MEQRWRQLCDEASLKLFPGSLWALPGTLQRVGMRVTLPSVLLFTQCGPVSPCHRYTSYIVSGSILSEAGQVRGPLAKL